MPQSLEDQKKLYAELLIKIGVNLQPDQGLWISTELAHREFVRLVVAEAYRAGAKYVHVDWADPISAKNRYLHGKPESLDYVPEWQVGMLREMVQDKWARLAIIGEEYPNLMDDIDPAVVRRAAVARAQKTRFYSEATMSNQMQWCVAAVPTTNWARKVLPNLSEEKAVARLWELILSTVRVDAADPVQAWRDHDHRLNAVVRFMASNAVRAVRFLDPTPAEDGTPSTDLTVGLTDAPVWIAASSDTPAGVNFLPNMPTEEVFSTPHRLRVHGHVRTSKPGFPLGHEVNSAYFRFERGELAEYRAAKGEDTLRQFFDIDGARHLGEVALVDVRSPINQSGALFYNTLFDENAVCHVAFGRAYPDGMQGATAMSEAERTEAGVNDSHTHCDLMIGTPSMHVYGLRADGSQVPVMENGQFVAAVFA